MAHLVHPAVRMAVNRFEDLRVWQAASKQSDRVGSLLNRPGFRRDPKLCDQMSGASLSVPLNIAEGFLRRRDKETAQFLRYAFASNGELKAAFYASNGRGLLLHDEFTELIEGNESIAKMLRRWQSTLDTDERNDRRKDGRGRRGTRDEGLRTDQGPGTDQEPRPKV